MDDLISRRALLEAIGKNIRLHDMQAVDVFTKIDEIIKAQPVAYDVNKVISEVKQIKGYYGYYGSEECEYVPYESTEEIIKAGGTNL